MVKSYVTNEMAFITANLHHKPFKTTDFFVQLLLEMDYVMLLIT